MSHHEFINTIHATSKQRLNDRASYREAFDAKEEIGLRSHAVGVEQLLKRDVRRPIRFSLGLILFLPHETQRIPLFWAGNDIKGTTHLSLIPEIMYSLPPEYSRASVWATRQVELEDGAHVVTVLPSKSREYEDDYGGPIISRELGLASLSALSLVFEDTPFTYRTWAYENGVEHPNSHEDRFR